MDLTTIPSITNYRTGLNVQIWRIMKITAFLIIVACLHVSATGHSQNVTLSEKNASLEKLFRSIHKQTGFQFVYNDEAMKDAKPVSINVSNTPLEEVLTICFQNQPLEYTMQNKAIVVKQKTQQDLSLTPDKPLIPPPISIKGKIANEKGEPMSATIAVKGKKTGTNTNANGEFYLEGIDEKAVLLITGIGIEPIEVAVNGRTDLGTITTKIRIVQSDAVVLNTGYQDIPKERAAGSFAKLTEKELNYQVGTDILKRLDGMVPGIQLDAESNRPPITVRGFSSINGPKSPLIIVDNFPYDGNIMNINPNDVESITILKDAAASSIWGARAGNGVIVITTKKGSFNKPVKVSFNYTYTISEKPDLFKNLQTIASSDMVDIETDLFNRGFFLANENDLTRPALTPVVDVLIARRNGTISNAEAERRLNIYRNTSFNEEVTKYLYQKPVTSQYSINISGGGKSNAFQVSTGYDRSYNELGALAERLNLKTIERIKISPKFEVVAGLWYTSLKNNSGRTNPDDIANSTRKSIYMPLKNEDGNEIPINKDINGAYTDTAGAGKLLSWKYLPLSNHQFKRREVSSEDIMLNIGMNYQLFSFLNLQLQYQYEKQAVNTNDINDVESYDARVMLNRSAQINWQTGVVNYFIPLGGVINSRDQQLSTHNLRPQINFQKTFGQHQFTAIGGADIRQKVDESQSSVVYGYDSRTLGVRKVDFVTTYKDYITGSNRTVTNNSSLGEITNRFLSYYFNTNYTFRNTYTLTGSIRKDQSNLIGVNKNERGVPLWSAGFLWDIGKEKFMKVNWIDMLKLRLTSGFAGNIDLSRSAQTVATFGTNSFNFPQARITEFANPELSWEKVNINNIGLDFSMGKGRITGNLDFYFKDCRDLLGPKPTDASAGLLTPALTANIANMKSWGGEFQLQYKVLDKKLKWDITILGAFARNEVTDYFLINNTGGRNLVTPNALYPNPKVGKSIYSLTSYAWAGLDPLTGDPRGLINGQPSTNYSAIIGTSTTEEDIIYHGPSVPEITGAIRNTVSFKKIELTFNLTYRGSYVVRKSMLYSGGVFGGIGHQDYYKRWKAPGDELTTTVPSLVYPVNSARDEFYLRSEIGVIPGDNIRLQFINLSYTPRIPINKKDKYWEPQFYINLSNVGIVWKKSKEVPDPDYMAIPPSRTCAVGIRFQIL